MYAEKLQFVDEIFVYFLPRNFSKKLKTNTKWILEVGKNRDSRQERRLFSTIPQLRHFGKQKKGVFLSDKLCAEFPTESCPSLIHFPTGSGSPFHQPLRSRARQKMAEGRENSRHVCQRERCNSAPKIDVARFLTAYIWFPLLLGSLFPKTIC